MQQRERSEFGGESQQQEQFSSRSEERGEGMYGDGESGPSNPHGGYGAAS